MSKRFIITEQQEKILATMLREDSYKKPSPQSPDMKKANKPYCINPEKVLLVKKFLDNGFTAHDWEKVGANGLPMKIKIFSMNASNGEPLKWMYQDQLHDLLVDHFQNMFMDHDERDLFMKQVLKDWINGSIGVHGTLSTNSLMENTVKEKLEDERTKINTQPTEKQCKAGNYKMGHISINGFEITIENPKGSYRKGKDKNGKQWKTLMHNDYGYFTKTLGKDGDAIDVFLGPYLDDKIEDAKIYPIDQFINGEFDETKIMMGFRDKESAKKAYLSNYDKDWKGFKYITEIDIDTFKKWLYDGHRQRKPFAKYVTLTESIKSIAENGEEKKLRDTVKAMVKDDSLSLDYSHEMAEHYKNIISRAFGINSDDVDVCSDDFRYYCSIIDDEFEKCGGKYDLMDCENHKKQIKKDLQKLHTLKESELKEIIYESVQRLLREGYHRAKNVNMNVELRKGGRNAVKMTEKQFEEILKSAWEEYSVARKYEKYYQIRRWSVGNFVYQCCYNSPNLNKNSKTLGALYKDIWCTKYKFDTENVECRGKIKMSNKGVPYLTCYAGGDWECPVCFIVYYDGNKLRAYIPLKGNAINRNTHEAFGGNTEKDAPFIAKELGMDEEEAKQYCSNIDYNEKACVEDFLSRIEVKGIYKEKDYSKIHKEYEELVNRLKEQDEEEKAKKEVENCSEEITEVKKDKRERAPKKCDKCGGKVVLEIHGEPVYLCSECGKYFGVKPFNVNESIINEKFKSNKLSQYAKQHGGIEVSINGGKREGANAWQNGKSIDLSQVTDDMLDGEPFTPERWSEEPNAICFNDGTMVKIKNHGNLPVPPRKIKPSKYGTGIGDTGNHDKHIGGFKTKDSITQKSAPYNGYNISDRAGLSQGYRQALQNNYDIINYFKQHPERADGPKQSRESQEYINKIHSNIKNDSKLHTVKEGLESFSPQSVFNNGIVNDPQHSDKIEKEPTVNNWKRVRNKLNHLMNLKNIENGEYISNTWYDWIGYVINGIAIIMKDNKYNLINEKGSVLLPEWHEDIWDNEDGTFELRDGEKSKTISLN